MMYDIRIIKYLAKIGDGCLITHLSRNTKYAWRIVNDLERLNLVYVNRLGRNSLIYLTPKGRRVVELYNDILKLIRGELATENNIKSSIPAEMPSFIKGNPWVTVLKSRRR